MVPRRTTPNLLPELLHTPPTPHIPNSSLPVLVYRQALATFPYDAILSLLQQNGWKKGGQWKTYKTAHFHSNVHECYVVIRGKCRYLLGCRPEDGATGGVEMDIEAGDVFVLPAGVSHCAVESEGEFEYVGFYVEDAPKWDMNYCTDDVETTRRKAEVAAKVPIPDTDPIYGAEGALPRVWKEVSAGA